MPEIPEGKLASHPKGPLFMTAPFHFLRSFRARRFLLASLLLGALLGVLAPPAALALYGAVASYTTADKAAQAIRNESAKWTRVIKEGTIKPE